MPDYDLSIRFHSKDEITPVLKRITGQSKILGANFVRDFGRMSKSALGVKNIIGGILGASVIQRGIGAMSMGIRGLTTEFLDFDQAITGAAAKWNIERGTDAFRELGTVARDVAKVTPYSAAQAGQGLDYLAMAGFDAKQAMAALPGVTELAISSNTDLAEASDIASDALSSLGLMVKDDTQLKENLSRVNDVFAKTTITSNTNLQMLFESMKLVAPVATGLGGDVEELSAMLGTLANAGIKASMSGTALRNMYLRLTGGTREVTKVLEKYHIEVSKDGKMRSMIDILEDIKTKTASLNDEQRQAAFTNLFGARAIASATVLMKAGSTELHRYETQLRNARGASKQLAEEMSKSWSNRLAAMKSQLIELGLKVFDIFDKEIPSAFKFLETTIANFDAESFVKWIKQTYEDLKTLAEFIGKVTNPIVEFAKMGSGIGVGLDDIAAGMLAFKVATMGASAAAAAFGVAAAPIALTVAGIGLAAYEMYKHWDKIAGAMDNVFKEIAYNFMKLLDIVSFGHLENVVGKGAAATYRAMDEIKRRSQYKKEGKPVTKEDIGTLTGESLAGVSSSVYGESVGDILGKYAQPAPEKSVLEVNVKAPDGTTASVKQGKGAPKIKANLGKQRTRPTGRPISTNDLADIHGM